MKKIFIILLSTILLAQNNCDDNPVNPENQHPVILSLTVFPEIIGPQDSVIVVCNAYDPDGDTLVYDWITDGRLKIKGAPDFDLFLYHTYENSRIFYPRNSVVPPDTLWVKCFVRDVKGGQVGSLVTFIVKNKLEGG